MELVKDAKIEPKPSDTNKAWREGLEAYWADEYTDAIAKFEEVETLFPTHSEAPTFLRLSLKRKKRARRRSRRTAA